MTMIYRMTTKLVLDPLSPPQAPVYKTETTQEVDQAATAAAAAAEAAIADRPRERVPADVTKTLGAPALEVYAQLAQILADDAGRA